MSLWNNIASKLIIPFLVTLIIVICYNLQVRLGLNPSFFGLHPRDWGQWWGIITTPLVHGDIAHLIFNISAFLGLSILLFFFYDNVAARVLALAWVLTGVFMFFFARPGYYHIGASGVVYAIVFYLLANGFVLKGRTPAIVALVVALYYGGTFWGLLPYDGKISWDGHLSGAVAGVLLALIFRKKAQKAFVPRYSPGWSSKDEEIEEDEYKKFG